ncbi:glucosamine-6-phosphate deaminase [Robertmurraya sp. DFI.2.37]|uniref:glucosamine-6-phosphate deaminase n=1 Tax=Robertmurraya sp. DFI.2.37 TaxID=3031819 RepID=UPI001245ABEB|nr:glucosamine-6-phosphate deaminase [Robertmurraya sp. DFI.2.37]MDF1510934.1 glucosamine-6-phosphate deaminase [Robertmurraya sp. DFI.2.37]
MEFIKVNDYQAMSERACSIMIETINRIKNPVLGLATGSTPEGLYQKIIEKFNEGMVSFQDVTTFNLDEYVGLEREDVNSYYRYMKEKLFDHVDIKLERVHLPNGAATDLEGECQRYERQIQQAGKIDLQILGMGINGHIGFNEPGTPFSSRTHVVELAASTREANSRFFPTLDDVPTQALTMGIASIMESKEILLLVSGEQKAEAIARLAEGDISEDFPASILRNHPNVTVIVDEGAMVLAK